MVLIVKDTINSLHFMNERTEAQNFPVRMGLRFPPRLSGLSLPPPTQDMPREERWEC